MRSIMIFAVVLIVVGTFMGQMADKMSSDSAQAKAVENTKPEHFAGIGSTADGWQCRRAQPYDSSRRARSFPNRWPNRRTTYRLYGRHRGIRRRPQ